MPDLKLLDYQDELQARRARLMDLQARAHGSPCEAQEACEELARQRCALEGEFSGPVELVLEGAYAAWNCQVNTEAQAEAQRRLAFPAADLSAAESECESREYEKEVSYVIKETARESYRCAFADSRWGPVTKCDEGQSAEDCERAALDRCHSKRNALAGSFNYMSTKAFPVDRTPQAFVETAMDHDSGRRLGLYVAADCAVESPEEVAKRQRGWRGNCNAYAACRYKNKVLKDRRIFAEIEYKRTMQPSIERESSSIEVALPEQGFSASSPSRPDGRVPAGLYIVADSHCVSDIDAPECSDVSTVCVERHGDRYTAQLQRRSPVLVRNSVPERETIFEGSVGTHEATFSHLFPVVGSDCKPPVIHHARSRIEVGYEDEIAWIKLEHASKQYDLDSCSIRDHGTQTSMTYYKTTNGDSRCSSSPGIYAPLPTTPPIIGGGVN